MAIYCEKHRTRGMCLDCAKEKREASAVASNDGLCGERLTYPELIDKVNKTMVDFVTMKKALENIAEWEGATATGAYAEKILGEIAT